MSSEKSRWVRLLLAPLLLFTSIIIAAPAANAAVIPDTCKQDKRGEWVLSSVTPWSSPYPAGRDLIASNVYEPGGSGDGPGGGAKAYAYGATAYEWFGGTNALRVTSTPHLTHMAIDNDPIIAAGCGVGFVARIFGEFAGFAWNMMLPVFDISLRALSISQSGWAVEALTAPWLDRVLNGEDTDGDGERDGAGTADIFRAGIILIVVIAVGYAIILVARGKIANAGKQTAWTIFTVALSGVLLANITLLPTLAQWSINTFGGALSGVTSQIMSTWVGGANWCSLDDSINYPDSVRIQRTVDGQVTELKPPSKTSRELTCTMWDLMLVENWRLAQFGTRDNLQTVDVEGWYSKSEKDSQLALTIPGLKNQPPAGDIATLQLSALTLSPQEQRWVEAQIAADPTGQTTYEDLVTGPLAGGYDGRTLMSNNDSLFDDDATRAYPLDEIAPGATGLNSYGHQVRYEALIERMSDLGGTRWLDWSGVSWDNRAIAIGVGIVGTFAVLGVVLFFSVISIAYQFTFGLRLILLPITLLGVALPLRWGFQIAKDQLAKFVENLVMVILAGVFAIFGAGAMVAIPRTFEGLIFASSNVATLGADEALNYSPAGAAVGVSAAIFTHALSIITGVIVIILWWKARKALAGRSTKLMGAREESAWDPASKVSRKVKEKTKEHAGTVTKAAVVGGTALATGGAAGLAVAAKDVGAKTARAAMYNRGRGGIGAAARRGLNSTVIGNFADDLPFVDDEEMKRKAEAAQEARRQRKNAKREAKGLPPLPSAKDKKAKAKAERQEEKDLTDNSSRPDSPKVPKIHVPSGGTSEPRKDETTETTPSGIKVKDRRAPRPSAPPPPQREETSPQEKTDKAAADDGATIPSSSRSAPPPIRDN